MNKFYILVFKFIIYVLYLIYYYGIHDRRFESFWFDWIKESFYFYGLGSKDVVRIVRWVWFMGEGDYIEVWV